MLKLWNVGLGLLLASMIGTTVYAYTDDDLEDLFGAGPLDGCKEPCYEETLTVTECDDLKGKVGECEKDRCTINVLHFVQCTPKDTAGSGAKDCDVVDKAEYWRFITVRKMVGCKDGGEKEYPYGSGSCAASGTDKAKAWTPCKTDECKGDIYDGIEDKGEGLKNRKRCKNPAKK